MGNHGKNFPGGHFRHHGSPLINIQLGICHLLNLHIQRGVHIITGIFHSGHIICRLIAQGSTRIDEIIICQRLHAHASLGGISHNVGEQFRERIRPGFILLLVQYSLCQHFPIPGINRSPVIPGQQNFLPGIVAVVDHVLFAGSGKISQMHNEHQKHCHKKHTCHNDFRFIVQPSGICFFSSLFLLGFFSC